MPLGGHFYTAANTRAKLADYVKDKGIQDKVLIPIDGETLSF